MWNPVKVAVGAVGEAGTLELLGDGLVTEFVVDQSIGTQREDVLKGRDGLDDGVKITACLKACSTPREV